MKVHIPIMIMGATLTLAQSGGAFASPVTFSEFNNANASNNYRFINNAKGAATFSSKGKVFFSFLEGAIPTKDLLQPLPIGFQLAFLTRTSATVGITTCIGPCILGATFSQTISDSIVLIRRLSDNATLLKITGNGGTITGQIGGSAGNFETSSPPDSLVFSSDFIDFSSAVSLSRAISFTSVTRAFAVAQDGVLRNFTAAGSGTFAADFNPIAVAEPAGLALLGLGYLGLIAARRRAL